MSSKETAHAGAALALLEAERTGQPIEPLSDWWDDITIADAYAVQRHGLDHRLNDGQRVVGRKIGLTSAAMQEMLGVDQPDFGYITDTMLFPSGAAIASERLIEPRIEAEIAFRFRGPLEDPITPDALLRTPTEIAPALEVIDSRVSDWRIKIADTIADNASSALVIVGDFVPLGNTDLAALESTLTVTQADGSSASVTGTGAAVLGHPANAIQWLADALLTYAGETIEEDQIILPGAMARAIPFASGASARATFTDIGSIDASF